MLWEISWSLRAPHKELLRIIAVRNNNIELFKDKRSQSISLNDALLILQFENAATTLHFDWFMKVHVHNSAL